MWRLGIPLRGIALFVATTAVLWAGLNLPPPLWLLSYGLAPGCEPTGRTARVERIEFVEVGPGCFRMGSAAFADPGDLIGRVAWPLSLSWGRTPVPSDEMPVHWVQFPRGYWISRHEVTTAEFRRFLPGRHEHRYLLADGPVGYVSPGQAEAYCEWLAGRTGVPLRLPTEAEWENACRAGARTEFSFGDDAADLGEYAWFDGNSGYPRFRAQEQPVGGRAPNAWGLHDLHGNASEWCSDSWHGSYVGAPTDGSSWPAGLGPAGSRDRVYRGGNWKHGPGSCRSAFRDAGNPDGKKGEIGFRPGFSLRADQERLLEPWLVGE